MSAAVTTISVSATRGSGPPRPKTSEQQAAEQQEMQQRLAQQAGAASDARPQPFGVYQIGEV